MKAKLKKYGIFCWFICMLFLFDWFFIGGMMEMSSFLFVFNGYFYRVFFCFFFGVMVNR